MLAHERDKMFLERDKLVQERDKLVQERDAMVQDRNRLAQERDLMVQEHNRVVYERDAMARNLTALQATVRQATTRKIPYPRIIVICHLLPWWNAGIGNHLITYRGLALMSLLFPGAQIYATPKGPNSQYAINEFLDEPVGPNVHLVDNITEIILSDRKKTVSLRHPLNSCSPCCCLTREMPRLCGSVTIGQKCSRDAWPNFQSSNSLWFLVLVSKALMTLLQAFVIPSCNWTSPS